MKEGTSHSQQSQNKAEIAPSFVPPTPQPEPSSEQSKLTIADFHATALAAGAYDSLPPGKRELLEEYLGTNVSTIELGAKIGRTQSSVQRQIQRHVPKIWMALPDEVRQQYQSPQAVMQLKVEEQRKKLSEQLKGKPNLNNRLKGRKRPPFSPEWRENISKANSRRWERYRTEKAQREQASKEQIIFEPPPHA